jgi:cellobiose phosphorylase
VDLVLEPGQSQDFGYAFAVADTWQEAEESIRLFGTAKAIQGGIESISALWEKRLGAFQLQADHASLDRFVNVWNPYNAFTTLEHCRMISTDHMGTDGLRFRDTSQDALAAIPLESGIAEEKLRLVLEQQKPDGDGCFAFYPKTQKPVSDTPHRSDNMVWPVYSYKALIAETGKPEVLESMVPFRDGSKGSIYEHLKTGLDLLWSRRGPHGLPKMLHADWNDGLALFQDPEAESVMLGFQLAAALNDLAELAGVTGRNNDAALFRARFAELAAALNSEDVWDGGWYRRLLLSNGKTVGSRANSQGRIYLDVQPWAVLSGVGEHLGRGKAAMQSVFERLASPFGLAIVEPAYRGFPEPTDPPLGSGPGTNENGGIFCHANTWAIIAECLLGNGERAFEYYSRLIPEAVIQRIGSDLYEREPYVYVSTLWGPESSAPGKAGISWLTGTASWMYVAVTQYILGIRPTLAGLQISPCLPSYLPRVSIQRKYRGSVLDILVENMGRGRREIFLDGRLVDGDTLVGVTPGSLHHVRCLC